MNSRVTLQDVAREAGVSPATVDRVLNDREGVRLRTREAVLGAARRLGYISAEPEGDPARLKPLRLVFLLPAGNNVFMQVLADQIAAQAAERPELRVTVERIEGFSPPMLAARLAEHRGQVDGVGVVAQDHPLVREAIRGLAAAGAHVVTLASDILSVPRVAYVGIDNRQAGRLAGHLVGRFLGRGPAKVALFAGSLAYRGHEEREMGFRHILNEEWPELRIVELREIRDDRDRAHAETLALLDLHPDLAAIYNVGAGTQGIAEALAGRQAGGPRIVLIGHEATGENKQLLLSGALDAVIDQNPRVEAREALNILTAAARARPYAFVPLRLQVIFRENLPDE